MNERFSRRHASLVEVMEQRSLVAIVLRTPANFAWFTGGGDNRVDHSSPHGVASIIALHDDVLLLANEIEAPRIVQEEVADIDVVSYAWYADEPDALNSVLPDGAIGSDSALPNMVDISGDVQSLRLQLDAEAVARYRDVGRDTYAAVNDVAASLRVGTTEFEAAGRLLEACLARELYVPVVMASGETRTPRFRHPIPHEGRCQRRVMLVVCAERGGLYANYTQFVHFDEPDAEWQRRQQACMTVLHRMRTEATLPGTTLGDAFQACRRFYADEGFPDEWKRHHQGGLTGYATREIIARPDSTQLIAVGQAFAWNPSITGAKAEETLVLAATGQEVVIGDASP